MLSLARPPVVRSSLERLELGASCDQACVVGRSQRSFHASRTHAARRGVTAASQHPCYVCDVVHSITVSRQIVAARSFLAQLSTPVERTGKSRRPELLKSLRGALPIAFFPALHLIPFLFFDPNFFFSFLPTATKPTLQLSIHWDCSKF